jgi:hypothetical protein
VEADINQHMMMAYTLPVKMARVRLAEVATVFVFDIVCIMHSPCTASPQHQEKKNETLHRNTIRDDDIVVASEACSPVSLHHPSTISEATPHRWHRT